MTASLRILVYSSNTNTRTAVTTAIGTHPDSALPAFEYLEVASEPMVVHYLDAGGIESLPQLGLVGNRHDQCY